MVELHGLVEVRLYSWNRGLSQIQHGNTCNISLPLGSSSYLGLKSRYLKPPANLWWRSTKHTLNLDQGANRWIGSHFVSLLLRGLDQYPRLTQPETIGKTYWLCLWFWRNHDSQRFPDQVTKCHSKLSRAIPNIMISQISPNILKPFWNAWILKVRPGAGPMDWICVGVQMISVKPRPWNHMKSQFQNTECQRWIN